MEMSIPRKNLYYSHFDSPWNLRQNLPMRKLRRFDTRGIILFASLIFCTPSFAVAVDGSPPPSVPLHASEIEGFRVLGPPTLEELDKLFPKAPKTPKTGTMRRPAPHHDNDSAADPIIQMLQSPDPAIRARAVEGLAGTDPVNSIPHLFIALADPEVQVRDAAKAALAAAPQDILADSIIGVIGWGNPAMAEAVTAALPELRNTLEAPFLRRFESQDTPRIERMAAAYCLGRIGSARAGVPLANEVWGNDLTLALYCADALVAIDEPGLLREYVRMASHPQVQMRVAAYRGLARIGGDDARRVLFDAARGQTEPDTQARKAAIRFLANVPSDEIVEYLMSLIRADAGLVRPSSDALAAMFGLPKGMHRGLWLDWYRDYYTPMKQSDQKSNSAKAGGNPGAGVPIGFPEGGFPFSP